MEWERHLILEFCRSSNQAQTKIKHSLYLLPANIRVRFDSSRSYGQGPSQAATSSWYLLGYLPGAAKSEYLPGRPAVAKPLVTSVAGKPKSASSVKGKAVSNEPKSVQRTQSASASVAKPATTGKPANLRTASSMSTNRPSNLSASVEGTRSKVTTKNNASTATPKVTASSSTTTATRSLVRLNSWTG